MNDTTNIIETTERWVSAERGGDPAGLRDLLADDFRAVGPVGYVLDKQQWMSRFDDGSYTSLAFENVTVRRFGDVAVAIGDHVQDGHFRGHHVEGSFRMTQVLVRDEDNWQIVSMHLSPIAEKLAA